MKNTVAFFTAVFSVLPGLPAGWFLAASFAPQAAESEMSFAVPAGMAAFVSYPFFLLQILFIYKKKYMTAFALLISGILARLFGLGGIAVYYMLNNQAWLQTSVLIYFSFIAGFLLFELVSTVALLIYDTKYRLKDRNS